MEQSQEEQKALQGLQQVFTLCELDMRTRCALMASNRSLASRLCTLPIHKLVVQLDSLDQALGAAQWLVAHGSSITSRLQVMWRTAGSTLPKDYDAEDVEELQHASRAVATALFSMRKGMLQSLDIRRLRLPASLFESSGSSVAWSSLVDLHLEGTGFLSILSLSSLTSLTSLQLGAYNKDNAAYTADYGLLNIDELESTDRVLQGTWLPVGLHRLLTIGVSFDNLAHLTRLTSLCIQPYEDDWGGPCPVFPVSTVLRALNISACDSFPECPQLALNSILTGLTQLVLSIEQNESALLCLALTQLPQLQCLDLMVQHGNVTDILPLGQLHLDGGQFGHCLETLIIRNYHDRPCPASSMQQLSSLTKLTCLSIDCIEAPALQHVSAVSSLVSFAAHYVTGDDVGTIGANFFILIMDGSIKLLKEVTLPDCCMGNNTAWVAQMCSRRGIVVRLPSARDCRCLTFG